MLVEPTTLSSVARLIGDTLQNDYDVDPAPLFSRLGIQREAFLKPGARTTFAKMDQLWREARKASKDPWFGFAVGERATPGDLFVLGHVWLASATLHGAFLRLCRYSHVVSNLTEPPTLSQRGTVFALEYPALDAAATPHKVAKDAGYVILLKLIDAVASEPIRPKSVSLAIDSKFESTRYSDLFGCPVEFGCEKEIWLFDTEEFEKPLRGSIPDITEMTDRIAKTYNESLDSARVSTEVSRILVQLLPSGRSDQNTVATRLYRSKSTLQRQLSAEGTSYRDILKATRQSLAERYLTNDEYSQAQVAFMVGFADQSNFSRAFKKWTGMSPGQFQANS